MTTRSVRAAIAAARIWTALYTWRLPHALRDRRRAEIESDLWESCDGDAADSALAWQIISRLLLGMADDVRWRVDHAAVGSSQRQRLAVALTAALLLTIAWIGVTARRVDPPQPPVAPGLDWRHRQRQAPPPPPPPPPPCNPPGIGRPAFSPCTPFPVRHQGGHS